LINCLGNEVLEESTYTNFELGRFALCGHEAGLLDKAKLERELAEGGYNDYAKTLAREQFGRVKVVLESYRKIVGALGDQDPTYRALFFEAPARAWKAWEEFHAAEKAHIALTQDFETKVMDPSRKALAGCAEPLREALQDYLDEADDKTVPALTARAASPGGFLLVEALAACYLSQGELAALDTLLELADKSRIVRGPRRAVYYAVLDALTEIKADRSDFPIEFDMIPTPIPKFGGEMNQIVNVVIKGIVEEVEEVPEGLLVSFSTEEYEDEVQHCFDTNKVWRVTEEGEIKFFRKCTSQGIQTFQRTEAPVVIPAYAASGIEEDAFVEIRGDAVNETASGVRLGYPVVGFKEGDRAELVNFYGFPVD
jgi:hypothetical protein